MATVMATFLQQPYDATPKPNETRLSKSGLTDDMTTSPVHTDHKDARACKLLVEEVFRPETPDRTSQADEEATLLPRLLNRVRASTMWAPGTARKRLSMEVQTLRAQRFAASELLDVIEHEAENIQRRLQEKEQEKRTCAQEKPSKGFLGLPSCMECANTVEREESFSITQPSALRQVLRQQMEEQQRDILEKDTEIHKLKHELDLLRKGQHAQYETARDSKKDVILDRTSNVKELLLRRYAAMLSSTGGFQPKTAFYNWKNYAHQRATRTKLLKRASLAFAAEGSQRMAFVFAMWSTFVREKKEAQTIAKNTRRKAMSDGCVAMLFTQSDATFLRATFLGWWRCSKESAFQARHEAMLTQNGALQQGRAGKPPVPPHAQTKACCVLM
jgi:hypothetical protein